MADNATKVTFDIKDALDKLDELNRKVGQAGDKIVEAFQEKGGKAMDTLQDGLSEISPLAGRLLGATRNLAAAMGPLGFAAAAAGGAIAALAVQFVDLPGLMRDTTESIEAFNAASDKLLRSQNTVSSVNDALINAENERIREAIKNEQALSALRQVEIQKELQRGQERVNIAKDVNKKIEDALEASVKRRESLEKRLADRTKQNAADGFGGPAGKRALDLGAAARRAAFEGDLDLAEELEQAAKKAGEEAGNHALFLKDQATTSDAINRSLEKQIGQEKARESQLGSLKKGAEDALKVELAAVKAAQDRLKAERLISQELAAQAKLAKLERAEQIDQQTRDEAARTITIEFSKLQKEFDLGDRSTREGAIDSLKQTFNALKDVRGQEGLAAEIKRGYESVLPRVSELLQKQRAGTLTFGDAKELTELSPQLAEIIRKASFESEQRGLGGFGIDLEKLGRFLDSIDAIGQATAKALRADATTGTRVREGEKSPFDRAGGFPELDKFRQGASEATKPMTDLGTAANNAAAALGRLSGTNNVGAVPSAPAKVPVPAQSQGAAPPTNGVANANITVNANIRGGMLDQETLEQFNEHIRREVRKATQNVA